MADASNAMTTTPTGTRAESRCGRCGSDVTPGTLFCWRHAASPPRIGELSADHGQLLWRTTGEATGLRERALAVFLDGEEVAVRHVEEALGARPVKLLVDVGPPEATGAASVPASIELARLLAAILAGDERIEATRAQ